jgi:TonB-linked SusC/RagA family outer membrane protein
MSYRDKYLLTASIRRDGSSRFGKDNRWGVFPSASLGWIISKESFMDKLKNQVSNLKLRGSYGIVGNDNIGDYSAIGLMDPANYVVGNTTLGGYIPSSFSNTYLGWEKTSTIDAGVDAGFIKDRINLTFDYYIANTNDLLLYVSIPQVTGFGSALQNIGKVQNKGYEIELLTKNLVGAFKWSTSFNISHNRNEVKELGPDGSPIIVTIYQSAKTITRIGDPIGSFYVFQTDGLFKNQADVEANRAMAYVNVKPQPGDLKYKDQNGDGIIDDKDLVIGGNNRPNFIWGLTNSFQYKGFDLSFFMDGQAGNKLLNVANGQNIQSRGNVRGYWRDRWKSEEDPGNGKIPRACVTDNMTTYSDFMLFDAGFWRIRNISFGYQIPQKILHKILDIASIKLYGSVDNVFMKDHYNHMAETATFSNSTITPGFDFDSGYPLARTYKLGINVKF